MAFRLKRISALRSGARDAPSLYRVMLLMGLYLVVVQINRSGGAVMASDLMSTRGYRPAEVGAFMGSMFLAAAVVQLPAGVLYDRHGPRVMLSAMNLVAVAGLIVLFAMVLALYLGYLVYGPLDRVFNTRKWVVLSSVAGMLSCVLPLAAIPNLPLVVAVPFLVVFAFCSPFFVTLAAHCRGFVPVHRVGRAIACINLMGLVNVFVLQAVAGVLVESVAGGQGDAAANGYRWVFAMVAVVLILTGSIYTRVRDVPVREAGDA